MRFKTLPIFTLATYRMGLNFSIRVTPNINSITVGLVIFLPGLMQFLMQIKKNKKSGFNITLYVTTMICK